MILSAIDFLMRLVIIERSSAPAEWFKKEDDIEKNIDNDNDSNISRTPSTIITSCGEENDIKKHHVTWLQLLKQPRLLVSLALTSIVATVMSAFEVCNHKILLKLCMYVTHLYIRSLHYH